MSSKPRIRLLPAVEASTMPGEPVTPLERARARFGRAFAHEPGSDYLRYPEPVLTRWGRKSEWRNINPNKERK